MLEETLSFEVQLHRHGVMHLKATVPAHEADLVGDWHKGKPYQPKAEDVRSALPHSYRKAFDRALKWWQDKSQPGRLMPLKCDLTSLKGEPMGTLFATPNWAAI